MIEEHLHQLGFSDKEQTLYLAVLGAGKITPTQLAKLTNINRTTVYSVAKELIKRRVIAEDLTSPLRYLLALPPNELFAMLQTEEKQLAEKKQLLQKTIIALEKVAATTQYSIPKITFIHEEELEKYLYSRTPEWNRSLLEVNPTWWGFQDETFVANYGAWIDWYWQQAVKPGIDLKLLSTETDIEQQMQAKGYTNRQIKYWAGLSIDATTWINGDYLVMIVSNQRPHYLVEIHDKVLARNQRAVFEQMWRKLETKQPTNRKKLSTRN